MNLNTEQQFSLVPQIHAPRSVFDRSFTHKTTMNVNKLYPIFIDEALPGDSMKLKFQVFGRLINPLVVPTMDELYFETIWFKCRMRLLWDNAYYFFGEKDDPSDNTQYVIPTINSGATGFAVDSLADHFGIRPNISNVDVNSLPFRFYNLAYNQWLRDQNLIASVTVPKGDTDDASYYSILTSAKMHDLFTSCLPTTQLSDAVSFSLGSTAPVIGNGMSLGLMNTDGNGDPVYVGVYGAGHTGSVGSLYSRGNLYGQPVGTPQDASSPSVGNGKSFGVTKDGSKSGLIADISAVTGINVNDLRFMFKLQQYREKLLTGGHRYREIISNFFNVDQLDKNPYTCEFLGMTREMIDINSVVQTSSTNVTSPQGHLTAYGVINSFESGFSTSFVEHSYIMGLARIRHNPVYQQGLEKMWTRETALDFYNPMFNGLGEQPVLNQEIMLQSNDVVDSNGDIVNQKAFGFNEAWYEYRYKPSYITGLLRTGVTGSLDVYHLAQYFGTYTPASGTIPASYTDVLPVLNQSFIEENIPIDRVLSVATSPTTPQFVLDFRFEYECAREIPVRNIPAGLYQGI